MNVPLEHMDVQQIQFVRIRLEVIFALANLDMKGLKILAMVFFFYPIKFDHRISQIRCK